VADVLEQYLDVTEAAARQQWRRIAARSWQKRQEAYLPIELILCFALFRLLNPHAFGGANLHRLPREARSLAEALKRPIGSLTNKMLNLEGFRANGAKMETELFLRLSHELDRFATLYVLVIRAARREGFGNEEVGDFLGWLDITPEPDLLGQDELGTRELDLALVDGATDVRAMEQTYGFDELATSRIIEHRVRWRQHLFANAVLAQYQHRCGFCGLDTSALRGHRLLVDSHIKPWAASDNRERLDPQNGIAACSIHDSAFDTGLLTVQENLIIRRATILESLLQPQTPADRLFGVATIQERLVVPDGMAGPGSSYLKYHARDVFRG
jgi:putative restriction endonuclease